MGSGARGSSQTRGGWEGGWDGGGTGNGGPVYSQTRGGGGPGSSHPGLRWFPTKETFGYESDTGESRDGLRRSFDGVLPG